MGYTQDYIGQLARKGKIDAKRVSGIWYVSEHEFSNTNHAVKDTDLGTPVSEKGEKANSFNVHSEAVDKGSIILDGVVHISSKRAAEVMGYTQDYIGQLVRKGKISARQIGRGWYIPQDAVQKAEEATPEEKNVPTEHVAPTIVSDKVEATAVAKEDENTNTFKLSPIVREHIRKEHSSPILQALYLEDRAPLLPTLRRTAPPVLHEILNDDQHRTVPIRRTVHVSSPMPEVVPEKREVSGDSIVYMPRQRSFSLLEAGIAGILVIVVASILTVTSDVITVRADESAQQASVSSEYSLLERIAGAVLDFFEDTVEYRAE